ncbi:MAG: ATP-binding cassette domain-containing protein, partial [Thermoleophilia bacterium]
MPLVSADNLVKKYGELTAVDGVSFRVDEGQIFGFLGPNGAGKSTTISMLSTYLPPSSGDALIDGYSIIRDPHKVKQIIGVVPQDIALYPTLTALQNLRFYGRMYDMGGSDLDNRCRELLDLVELWDRRDSRIEQFSGGMKRRINMAAGLLHHPRFLLLDEPTVGVDPQSREHIFDTIFKIRDSGTTILYTSHYMEEVELLCDYIAIMDKGKMVAGGTLQELLGMLGEGSVIELEVSPPGCPAGLAQQINEQNGVTAVGHQDDRLTISSKNSAHSLPPVLKVLEDSGCEVSHLEIYTPNLEKLFIH